MEQPEYFKTTFCIRHNDLQIAEQEGKVRNEKPGGAENMNDAPAEDTRQERYRRYQRYEELNRRHREKKKAVGASGFHRNRQDGKSGRRCKQSLI